MSKYQDERLAKPNPFFSIPIIDGCFDNHRFFTIIECKNADSVLSAGHPFLQYLNAKCGHYGQHEYRPLFLAYVEHMLFLFFHQCY